MLARMTPALFDHSRHATPALSHDPVLVRLLSPYLMVQARMTPALLDPSSHVTPALLHDPVLVTRLLPKSMMLTRMTPALFDPSSHATPALLHVNYMHTILPPGEFGGRKRSVLLVCPRYLTSCLQGKDTLHVRCSTRCL